MKPRPRPRDFIQTKENLIFAVVSYFPESDKILSFLRYVPEGSKFKKVNTKQAGEILKDKFREYLFYSKKFDAHLHGIPLKNIKKIFYPQERLREILDSCKRDDIEEKILKLSGIFNEKGIPFNKMGISGSVLIKNHNKNSDIDLAIYGTKNFRKARKILEKLITSGEVLELNNEQWKENYDRRKPAISYDEFLRHEKRKYNKGIIDGTKFDLLFVKDTNEIKKDTKNYKKKGKIKVIAEVIDDKFSYDYPARYKIKGEFSEVASFTHTYVGQAKKGEVIEVSGIIEEYDGKKRIVVGTTREAGGEYIVVRG